MKRSISVMQIKEVPWYLPIMLKSVREHMDWPIVLMTDETLDVSDLDVDEVIRRPCGERIALSRIEHLYHFPHKETLNLDNDVIIRKNILDVFDNPFDVALTWRQATRTDNFGRPLNRFNSGVMFSRSKEFWADCLEWFKDKGDRTAEWGGEQRSVNFVSGAGKFAIHELPCSTYNWSPSQHKQRNDKAHVWHYKGSQRKQWMKSFE